MSHPVLVLVAVVKQDTKLVPPAVHVTKTSVAVVMSERAQDFLIVLVVAITAHPVFVAQGFVVHDDEVGLGCVQLTK